MFYTLEVRYNSEGYNRFSVAHSRDYNKLKDYMFKNYKTLCNGVTDVGFAIFGYDDDNSDVIVVTEDSMNWIPEYYICKKNYNFIEPLIESTPDVYYMLGY